MCYPIKLTGIEHNIKQNLNRYYYSLSYLTFRGRMFALENYRQRMHLDEDADFEEKIFTVMYLQSLIERVYNALRAYNVKAIKGIVPFDQFELD